MVNKFTPGPWSIESANAPNGEFQIIAPDDRGAESWNIAKTHGSVGYGDDEVEALANARLIAAAPDLFSIVARLVAMPGGAWNPDRHAAEEAELMADARAALAKASDGGA